MSVQLRRNPHVRNGPGYAARNQSGTVARDAAELADGKVKMAAHRETNNGAVILWWGL
jgi:hypothetical protein